MTSKLFNLEGRALEILLGIAYRNNMSAEDVLSRALLFMDHVDKEAVRGHSMASIDKDFQVVTRYKVFKND